MESFLETYGYFALFVGTFLEGEVILALAGLAAYEGWMSFPMVVTLAAVGGFLGDQFFFFLGRRYGDRILSCYPNLAAKAPQVKALLCRWDAPLVILVRFMYGLRIAGPIIIGAAGIPLWRLALFNFIGAIIWAPIIAGAGYLAGHALQRVMHDLELAKIVVLVIVVCGALVAWLKYRR